jgi:hypothetical protein
VSDSNQTRRSGLKSQRSVVNRLVKKAEQRQQAQANPPSDGRGRAGHAGERGVDKTGRAKATYNIPVDRQAMVREMAQAEEVSQADIVESAIVAFYNAWQDNQVDLHPLKAPTRSLKAIWKLEIPDDFQLFSE